MSTNGRELLALGRYPHLLRIATQVSEGDRIINVQFHLTDRLVGHLLINRRHKIVRPDREDT